MRKIDYCLLIGAILFTVSGCAPPVRHEPSAVPSPTTPKVIRFIEQVSFRLPTGYGREIRTGSEWVRMGEINESDVFKIKNDVFTLEGTHVHEAWLIIRGTDLVGFYLPVEKAVNWLATRIHVNFQ